MGDHHPGIDAALAHQERGQAADQGIDQTVEPALGRRSQLGHGQRQEVGGEGQRLAVGMGIGKDARAAQALDHQGIVAGRTKLDFDLAGHMGELVQAGAVNLGNGAQAEGILGSDPLAARQDLAAR